MTNYTKQANDFLISTNTKIKIDFKKYGKHFANDTEQRDIYRIKISNKNGSFSFDFGQSIKGTVNKETPNSYDVLACLTTYDVGSFNDFCGDFGYSEDSRAAEKIYKAVCKEFLNVSKIWSDTEIETLQEIN